MTPEHPFYTAEGEWVAAGDLCVGDRVRQADGRYGEVEAVEVVEQPQAMYNLTVAKAHTYFVGEGRWLVHNSCLPGWIIDANTLVSYGKTLETAYKKSKSIPSTTLLDEIVQQARKYGVDIRLDPPHPGTPWEVPHLNIGKQGVHIPVPSGYHLP